MPAKSEITQGELAAVAHVHREARRSDAMFAGTINSKTGPRPARPSMNATSENVSMNVAAGRRSPRVGGGGPCTTQPRLARTSTGPRASGALGGALGDITNVAANRPGQAYGKSSKQSITGQVPLGASSATVGSRQLSARGPGEVHSHIPPAVLGVAALTAEGSCFQVDPDDAQSAHEYAAEIYSLLFKDEAAFLPRANYMDSQTDINGKMRAILIDWLIEVHMKYRLRSETLFLTVNLIDRYLSRTRVMRKKLQLVGVVGMFIAAKFEEINPPEIKDFVHITDNAYTKDDVLTMECTMLTTLNFQIVVPTATQFFDRLQKVNQCDDQHRELAAYIVELSLLEIRMLCYQPSLVVSAALLLSNVLLGKRPSWPQSMVQHSRHSEQGLIACTEELREFLDAAPKAQLQAVRKKFSQPQRHNVARMTFA